MSKIAYKIGHDYDFDEYDSNGHDKKKNYRKDKYKIKYFDEYDPFESRQKPKNKPKYFFDCRMKFYR